MQAWRSHTCSRNSTRGQIVRRMDSVTVEAVKVRQVPLGCQPDIASGMQGTVREVESSGVQP